MWHNNYITIVKAFLIIFMVIGHSGCPEWIGDLIYSFHMPAFFICSGFFFSPSNSIKEIKNFSGKKIKGLYLPYLKWATAFLFLHNVFFYLNFYSVDYSPVNEGKLYEVHDYLFYMIKILTLTGGTPQLLLGFWFLRDLFFCSIFIAILSYFINFERKGWLIAILMTLFTVSVVLSYFDKSNIILLLRDVTWGGYFFVMGYAIKNVRYPKVRILFCAVIFLLLNYFADSLSFQANTIDKMSFFAITTFTGTIVLFRLSKYIELFCYKGVVSLLYYIGNHTLAILALHSCSFKIINYLIVKIYGLPIESIANSPTMHLGSKFCLLYIFVGIFVPISVLFIYERFLKVAKLA